LSDLDTTLKKSGSGKDGNKNGLDFWELDEDQKGLLEEKSLENDPEFGVECWRW